MSATASASSVRSPAAPEVPQASVEWPETWEEICAHPLLQNLPFKIEQGRYGHILMSPPFARHAKIQYRIARILEDALGGTPATECPVQTSDGVKVPDVVWMSDSFEEQHGTLTVYEVAPPICVEVMSPSNPWPEMEEKITLYLARGAQEVWICEAGGTLRWFGHEGERDASSFVADAPAAIEL